MALHLTSCNYETINCQKCEVVSFKRQKRHEHDCIGDLKKKYMETVEKLDLKES